jgi:hypothetical protein
MGDVEDPVPPVVVTDPVVLVATGVVPVAVGVLPVGDGPGVGVADVVDEAEGTVDAACAPAVPLMRASVTAAPASPALLPTRTTMCPTFRAPPPTGDGQVLMEQ